MTDCSGIKYPVSSIAKLRILFKKKILGLLFRNSKSSAEVSSGSRRKAQDARRKEFSEHPVSTTQQPVSRLNDPPRFIFMAMAQVNPKKLS